MKKALVLLALAAALPVAAGAQIAPPIRVAQPAAPANGHGITVNGSSNVRVAASSARITLDVASTTNKGTLTQQTLAPLVDALVKAGAERSSVQLPLAFSAGAYSNVATVTAVIANPSVETMRSGIATVGAAVAGMNDIRLNSARIELRNADCTQSLEKARANAIDAAHSKAALIAKQLGVALGGVVNVNAFDQGNPDGSCASQYFVGPMGAQFPQGGDTTDADYVTVSVTSNVTITYAIK